MLRKLYEEIRCIVFQNLLNWTCYCLMTSCSNFASIGIMALAFCAVVCVDITSTTDIVPHDPNGSEVGTTWHQTITSSIEKVLKNSLRHHNCSLHCCRCHHKNCLQYNLPFGSRHWHTWQYSVFTLDPQQTLPS